MNKIIEKKPRKKTVVIGTQFEPDDYAKISQLSKQSGVSRSRIVHNLTLHSLDKAAAEYGIGK